MRRITLALTLAASLACCFPALAAVPRKRELHTYSSLYHAVKREHGSRTPGRNIRRYGVVRHGQVHPATAREVARSIRTFRRWLAPPMGHQMPGDSTSANPAYAGGRWAIPAYIVSCESGGSYSARNGQYYGAYQIGDFHWQRGGVCYGLDKSPAGQDQCAARIWKTSGPGAWACA